MQESQERAEYTLVARKPSFGFPTGCPICLPLFIYLKFPNFPFDLVFNNTFPDSEQLFTAENVESSMLQSALLEHGNLIRYAEKLKTDFLEAGSSSSAPQFLSDASSTSTRHPSNSGSKPKKQPKRERTEEERTFRRRARYFLVTQVVAVLVFLSVMSSNDFSEVEVDDDDDDDEGFSYD